MADPAALPMNTRSDNNRKHADHDHAACIADALADAESYCRHRGLRLTPTRRRVLEIVWRGHDPVKAYDILDELNRAGRRATPPTVYRALDFLMDASLIHRIDSLNAFVGCPLAGGEHTAQLLVCSRCETVKEIDDPAIRGILDQGASRYGFYSSRKPSKSVASALVAGDTPSNCVGKPLLLCYNVAIIDRRRVCGSEFQIQAQPWTDWPLPCRWRASCTA